MRKNAVAPFSSSGEGTSTGAARGGGSSSGIGADFSSHQAPRRPFASSGGGRAMKRFGGGGAGSSSGRLTWSPLRGASPGGTRRNAVAPSFGGASPFLGGDVCVSCSSEGSLTRVRFGDSGGPGRLGEDIAGKDAPLRPAGPPRDRSENVLRGRVPVQLARGDLVRLSAPLRGRHAIRRRDHRRGRETHRAPRRQRRPIHARPGTSVARPLRGATRSRGCVAARARAQAATPRGEARPQPPSRANPNEASLTRPSPMVSARSMRRLAPLAVALLFGCPKPPADPECRNDDDCSGHGDPGHSESAWATNRRAELTARAGQ